MNIQKTMHPEVVLGKRGLPEHQEVYRKVHESMHIDPTNSQISFPTDSYVGMMAAAKDENALEHFVLTKLFKRFSAKTYYIPKDFLQALAKVDREIPFDVLPEKFLAYFHFGDFGLSDDTGPVEGAYVYVGPAKEIGLRLTNNEDPDTRALSVSYINALRDYEKPVDFWTVSRLCTYAEKRKVGDLGAEYDCVDFRNPMDSREKSIASPEQIELRSQVWRAAVNAAVYVHSANPDLMKLRPMADMTKSEKRRFREGCPNSNHTSIPVTLLNWEYQGGKQYSVDSTVVQTHMRWQRCGPGRSQVDLIWVKEHERHYNKKEAST